MYHKAVKHDWHQLWQWSLYTKISVSYRRMHYNYSYNYMLIFHLKNLLITFNTQEYK